MKYKKIFTAWWFWGLISINLVLTIFINLKNNIKLPFFEIVGILIGSFLAILFFTSLFWVISWGLGKLTSKT